MEKQRWEGSEKRREEKRREEKKKEERRKKKEERRSEKRRERVRGKKMQVRKKVEKPRFTAFFQWFVAPEAWIIVGSLKRRVRSHLARWEMKNCTPLWREAHFEVKTYKTHCSRSTFGSWDDENEKVHAVVARKILRSQKCKILTVSDHSWKLRWWKSARRCGAKNICKSQCTKHTILGALLEIEMLKKRTLLWREAHFQVKMLKHHMFGPLLDVHMSLRVAGARDCAPCQKWAKHAFPQSPKTKLQNMVLHSASSN